MIRRPSQRRRRRAAAAAALILVITLSVDAAFAGIAARQRNVPAGTIFTTNVTLAANSSYVIATDELSPGADTVLYVWDPATNQQVAANDDFGGTLGSSVTIFASPSTRTVKVIVRAFSAANGGVATLHVTGPGGTSNRQFAFTAGVVPSPSPTSLQAHTFSQSKSQEALRTRSCWSRATQRPWWRSMMIVAQA